MSDDATKEIAVIGAGLVGSLAAIFLADRGHDVAVYERRPHPRLHPGQGGRSINLVLTNRGIRALEQVRLDAGALALTVPVTGRMVHALDGSLAFQPYGRDASECNYSIPRAGLNDYLIDEAIRRGVRFRFDSRLIGTERSMERWEFEDLARGGRFEIQPAVVLGADGAGSAVRDAIAEQRGVDARTDLLEHGYKELEIPAGPRGQFRIEAHALHIWPRGAFMLMALPNRDGSFTVTLYLPHRGRLGFEAVDSADRVLELFGEHFPDSVGLIPDLTKSYFANPTGSLGTVRCGSWRGGDKALLIGDAAHAIVPFFGQGMNCGFEDCTVLGELLDRADGASWGEIFEEFERLRKPNADAIAEMALENFVEMRDKVGDPAFLLRKRVEHRLELEMPAEYRSRYSMVMYSQIPYATAMQAGRIQSGLLDELCAGLDSADDLDVERARSLIGERLAPFLAEQGVALDY